MKTVVVGIAIVLSCLFVLAAEVDVTGTWDLTTVTQRGDRTRPVEMKQQGEVLKVVMEGRDGAKMEAEGTVKGDDIAWSITRETPRGKFTLSYTGKIEGDSMKGKVQMGDFGTGDWSAVKK